MELKKSIADGENIKYFDVIITDAYLKDNVVFIPSEETIDTFFYDAAVKGKPKTFFILTGKN